MRRRGLLTGMGVLAAGIAPGRGAVAAPAPTGAPANGAPVDVAPVDVALVLAIDVSGSVTEVEATLQRDGYRGAITDPGVLGAIGGGVAAAIAIAYVEWANYGHQDLIMPWTRIAGRGDAEAWSATLHGLPFQSEHGTSLSGALKYSGQVLAACPFQASRQVVDVSGDGSNNNGPPAEEERDKLVEAGVTINGLPIINRAPRFGYAELDVDKYYAASVIGGVGAFLIVAEDFANFADAIKRKLVQEISFNQGIKAEGRKRFFF